MNRKEAKIVTKDGSFLGYLSIPPSAAGVDAGSSHYVGGISAKLNEMSRIRVPTVLRLAGDDTDIPQQRGDVIAAPAKTNPALSMHPYPGRPHAFCREHDPRHFNAEASALALFKGMLA